MAKTATSTPSLDLEPIDRLAETLKLLASLGDRLKHGAAGARGSQRPPGPAGDTQPRAHELDTLRGRLAASESTVAELTTLKEERDVIRTRVSDMLEQLEAL